MQDVPLQIAILLKFTIVDYHCNTNYTIVILLSETFMLV